MGQAGSICWGGQPLESSAQDTPATSYKVSAAAALHDSQPAHSDAPSSRPPQSAGSFGQPLQVVCQVVQEGAQEAAWGDGASPQPHDDFFASGVCALARVVHLRRLALLSPAALDLVIPSLVALTHAPEAPGDSRAATDDDAIRSLLHAPQALGDTAAAAAAAGVLVFLQVSTASGTWGGRTGGTSEPTGGGSDAAATQRRLCTEHLRRLCLGGGSSRDQGIQPILNWQQGVCRCIALQPQQESLYLKTVMLEEEDGTLHPAVLLKLARLQEAAGSKQLQLEIEANPLGRPAKVLDASPMSWVSPLRPQALDLAHNRSSPQMRLQPPPQPSQDTQLSAPTSHQATLMRSMSIVANVPFIATLFDPEGGAVFQNDLSLHYWGRLTADKAEGSSEALRGTAELLESLMALEAEDMASEVLAHVRLGLSWKKVLQVPGVLHRAAVHGDSLYDRVEHEHNEGQRSKLRHQFSHPKSKERLPPLEEGDDGAQCSPQISAPLSSSCLSAPRARPASEDWRETLGTAVQPSAKLLTLMAVREQVDSRDWGSRNPKRSRSASLGKRPGSSVLGSGVFRNSTDEILEGGVLSSLMVCESVDGEEAAAQGAAGQTSLAVEQSLRSSPAMFRAVNFREKICLATVPEQRSQSQVVVADLDAVMDLPQQPSPCLHLNEDHRGATVPSGSGAEQSPGSALAEADDSDGAEGDGGDYSSGDTEAGAGEEGAAAHMGQAWHDIEAVPITDPVTEKNMLLLLQMDITARAEMEKQMAALTETQLNMLEQMFPRHILEYMISGVGGEGPSSLAHSHQGVTILFMDIVGFETLSKEVEPAHVMSFLNDLFTLFDELTDQYGVYKVETAGDCYIVAGALMHQDEEGFLTLEEHVDVKQGAERVMAFAKAMLRCAKTVTMPHNGLPTTVRVGMHTGPVVTGLIGTKLPKFSIFGDTMNTASRMESTSKHGCIQVSKVTYQLLSSHTFTPTGGVEVKGKGLMETFLWIPEDHPEEEYGSMHEQAQEASALIAHVSKQHPDDGAALVQSATSIAMHIPSLDWLPELFESGMALPEPPRAGQADDALGLGSSVGVMPWQTVTNMLFSGSDVGHRSSTQRITQLLNEDRGRGHAPHMSSRGSFTSEGGWSVASHENSSGKLQLLQQVQAQLSKALQRKQLAPRAHTLLTEPLLPSVTAARVHWVRGRSASDIGSRGQEAAYAALVFDRASQGVCSEARRAASCAKITAAAARAAAAATAAAAAAAAPRDMDTQPVPSGASTAEAGATSTPSGGAAPPTHLPPAHHRSRRASADVSSAAPPCDAVAAARRARRASAAQALPAALRGLTPPLPQKAEPPWGVAAPRICTSSALDARGPGLAGWLSRGAAWEGSSARPRRASVVVPPVAHPCRPTPRRCTTADSLLGQMLAAVAGISASAASATTACSASLSATRQRMAALGQRSAAVAGPECQACGGGMVDPTALPHPMRHCQSVRLPAHSLAASVPATLAHHASLCRAGTACAAAAAAAAAGAALAPTGVWVMSDSQHCACGAGNPREVGPGPAAVAGHCPAAGTDAVREGAASGAGPQPLLSHARSRRSSTNALPTAAGAAATGFRRSNSDQRAIVGPAPLTAQARARRWSALAPDARASFLRCGSSALVGPAPMCAAEAYSAACRGVLVEGAGSPRMLHAPSHRSSGTVPPLDRMATPLRRCPNSFGDMLAVVADASASASMAMASSATMTIRRTQQRLASLSRSSVTLNDCGRP